MLPAGPAQAHLSSWLSCEACTVFGAVAIDVVISVPLPRCSDPDDVRRNSSKEKKLHKTGFQDDMFLFYIIGMTENRAKIPPSRSHRKSNQENYVRLEWAPSWGWIILGSGRKDSGLGRRSQADLVVCSVKDGEVLADEDVTQDPEIPGGGGEVHALETTDALIVALEKRTIKPEMGHRLSSGRRWGLSIKRHGLL